MSLIFERFPHEGVYAAHPRQIIHSSKQKDCDNCEKWAKHDIQCDLYMYNEATKDCTKLKTLHKHDAMVSILTNPHFDVGTAQLITPPHHLITHNTEFAFDNQYHQVLFEEAAKDACECRQKATRVNNCRFVQYDNKTKRCTGISKTNNLSNIVFGVKRGKPKSKVKQKNNNNNSNPMLNAMEYMQSSAILSALNPSVIESMNHNNSSSNNQNDNQNNQNQLNQNNNQNNLYNNIDWKNPINPHNPFNFDLNNQNIVPISRLPCNNCTNNNANINPNNLQQVPLQPLNAGISNNNSEISSPSSFVQKFNFKLLLIMVLILIFIIIIISWLAKKSSTKQHHVAIVSGVSEPQLHENSSSSFLDRLLQNRNSINEEYEEDAPNDIPSAEFEDFRTSDDLPAQSNRIALPRNSRRDRFTTDFNQDDMNDGDPHEYLSSKHIF